MPYTCASLFRMSNIERTSWRDQALSCRLRDYGCYFTDIDSAWCVAGHSGGFVSVVIEYRHHKQAEPLRGLSSLRALGNLWRPGSPHAASIPLFVARYWTGPWAFEVLPFNPAAAVLAKSLGWAAYDGKEWLPPDTAKWIPLTERAWVDAMRRCQGNPAGVAPMSGYGEVWPPHDELASVDTDIRVLPVIRRQLAA